LYRGNALPGLVPEWHGRADDGGGKGVALTGQRLLRISFASSRQN
jgi:hypothetical protein